MTRAADPVLERALTALAPPGLLIGCRSISPGDENSLLPDEARSITSAVPAQRRVSGAARMVARGLLARLGHQDAALPRGPSGAPVWPAGVTGSLAHDDAVAVAAVGHSRDFGAVGIDVEPALPLPPDMLGLVALPQELEGGAGDPLRGRLLFSAKESIYKAACTLDGVFLEFHDIAVDLSARTATTKSGRTLALRFVRTPRIATLAFASA